MTLPPTILSPRTPSELLTYIIACQRYPTTLLVGCTKQDFIGTLALDVSRASAPSEHGPLEVEHPQPDQEEDEPPHPLLRAPLMQVVVSRHIRTVFVPTITHLRAYLSSFSIADSKVTAPPVAPPGQQQRQQPLLLVYGFLELHRGSSEWSAQALGVSCAALVDAAVGEGLRAAVVEPRGAGGHEDIDQFLDESLPVLNGSTVKSDGSWRGRITQIRKVLDLSGYVVANDDTSEQANITTHAAAMPEN